MRFRKLLLLVLLWTAGDPASSVRAQAPSVAGERYYMTLFGTQSVPFRTRYTHTWAIFARTAMTPAGEVVVAVDTISWMPATLEIRPLALVPEPGVNISHLETVRWLASFDGRVSAWGPYEI